MKNTKTPRSLRTDRAAAGKNERPEPNPTGKVSIACLVAVGSITGAEAPQAPPRPPAAKPTAEQLKVRAALRRQAQQAKQAAQAASAPAPNAAAAQAPD